MKFTYFAPTKVYFGAIDSNELNSEINKYGKNILLVSGGDSTTNIAKQLISMIDKSCSVELCNGITTNPLSDTIESIAQNAKKPDLIISVGGGSVHDSAKSIAILMSHQGRLKDFATDGSISVPGITDRTLPVITIPTISGSGAEVSPAALVRIDDKKKVIFSPNIYPKATFIDPAYATTATRDAFVKTALDALIQGIESYVSTSAQDFSRRYSLSAINRVINSLLNMDRFDNRTFVLEQIALASIESLYAVGQSTVGAVHAISDPLSGIFDIHHGESVAFLLPFVVEINYAYAQKQYDEIQTIFDQALGKPNNSLKNSILEFYDCIGFDYKHVAKELNQKGISKYLEQCVKDSYNNDMEGNPRDLNDELITNILITSLGE